jgi:hypothetical protein
MSHHKYFPRIVAISIPILFWMACDFPVSQPRPNQPPSTRLTNIPRGNDTIFPLATLYWIGGDNDGFVEKYQYRILTERLILNSQTQWAPADSTDWIETRTTSTTIAFNSADALNKQHIFVRAIDNDGAIDPQPAERILYTTRASRPITTLVYPPNNDTVLVSTQITDWWPGVRLTFKAVDQTIGGQVVDFGYSIDDAPIQWGKDTTIYLSPSLFKQPLSGQHKIKVTSRNNTNLIDIVGDSVRFVLFPPPFDKKVLVIDETDERNPPFIGNFTDIASDAFYADVFPGSDSWDFIAKGMPPRPMLAHYQLIVWHADDVPASVPHKIADPKNIAVFTDYLSVGGKFLMSGSRILKSFAYYSNYPFSYPPGSFPYDILHIRTVDQTSDDPDCIGGYGVNASFSDFSVDSVKLSIWPYSGKLSNIDLITNMAGFTDILYTYKNELNSPYVKYRGKAVALRYYGTVYDAVVLGFPMFFVKKDDAKRMAIELMQSLHVN